jgi:hypothetical protein
MAYRIIGILEGRNGHLAILPDAAVAVGEANHFNAYNDAQTVAEAMKHQMAKEKATLRYLVVPTIDDALLKQLHGGSAAPAPVQNVPQLTFGQRGDRTAPPA